MEKYTIEESDHRVVTEYYFGVEEDMIEHLSETNFQILNPILIKTDGIVYFYYKCDHYDIERHLCTCWNYVGILTTDQNEIDYIIKNHGVDFRPGIKGMRREERLKKLLNKKELK